MKIKYLAVKDENHPFKAWLFNAFSGIFAFIAGPLLVIFLIFVVYLLYSCICLVFQPFSVEATMEPLLLYRAASISLLISFALFVCSLFIDKILKPRPTIIVSIISIVFTLPYIGCMFFDAFVGNPSSIAGGVLVSILSNLIPILIIFFSARRIKAAREYL